MSPVARENIYFYIQISINLGIIGLTILLGFNLYLSKMFQTLHDDMVRSLLFSPLSLYEKISNDKIITRLSNDLYINDQIITSEFNYTVVHLRLLVLALISILYIFFKTQTFILLGLLIGLMAACCYYFSYFYGFRNKINNLEKDLITSFNGFYSETVDGLSTIRAYNKVEVMFSSFQSKMSTLSSAFLIRIAIDAKILLSILLISNILEILKISMLIYFE
jgi:ATP-binding cassette subfamily C (CFTR/MRP) protein 1